MTFGLGIVALGMLAGCTITAVDTEDEDTDPVASTAISSGGSGQTPADDTDSGAGGGASEPLAYTLRVLVPPEVPSDDDSAAALTGGLALQESSLTADQLAVVRVEASGTVEEVIAVEPALAASGYWTIEVPGGRRANQLAIACPEASVAVAVGETIPDSCLTAPLTRSVVDVSAHTTVAWRLIIARISSFSSLNHEDIAFAMAAAQFEVDRQVGQGLADYLAAATTAADADVGLRLEILLSGTRANLLESYQGGGLTQFEASRRWQGDNLGSEYSYSYATEQVDPSTLASTWTEYAWIDGAWVLQLDDGSEDDTVDLVLGANGWEPEVDATLEVTAAGNLHVVNQFGGLSLRADAFRLDLTGRAAADVLAETSTGWGAAVDSGAVFNTGAAVVMLRYMSFPDPPYIDVDDDQDCQDDPNLLGGICNGVTHSTLDFGAVATLEAITVAEAAVAPTTLDELNAIAVGYLRSNERLYAEMVAGGAVNYYAYDFTDQSVRLLSAGRWTTQDLGTATLRRLQPPPAVLARQLVFGHEALALTEHAGYVREVTVPRGGPLLLALRYNPAALTDVLGAFAPPEANAD